jgi:CRP/FNR family transcriptional regulator, anaerobic regulatory protein
MDKLSILNQFDFFRNASSSLQEELESQSNSAHLERGSYFYREGDYCAQFALIGKGNIRVFRATPAGRQITLYHLHEGQTCLVNMLCAFLHQPTPASAQAESSVDALLVPANVFRHWVKTAEVVTDHVFRLMSSRVVEVMTLVEEVAFRKMDRRIAALLLNHSDSPEMECRTVLMTHEDIAAELGTAREVVSRVLKDLEHQGAIEMERGQLQLRDCQILRELIRQ